MEIKDIKKEAAKYKGKSKTGHEEFDRDGSLFVPNLLVVDGMVRIPEARKQNRRYIKDGTYVIIPQEITKSDGFETYGYPEYKSKYFEVKRKLEKILGKRLHQTYYFDRFYFNGDDLKYHQDRPACQISVSINIEQPKDCEWPFYITTPDNRTMSHITKPGDGVIYKGCECPHWRERLNCTEKEHYHQIFMHYVLQDGHLVEHAFDAIDSMNFNPIPFQLDSNNDVSIL